ncbi:MAG: kynureninase [Alphaproteobacteria bacterium]|nr:kynureninase [Alphaproteobacteria bacterium]
MITRADCEALDRADPLRRFRDRFELPLGVIYLDGNSLGAMPKSARTAMNAVMEQWSRDLISSWNIHSWIDIYERVGMKIGKLIGAGEGETIAGDSSSVNLFKVLAAALALRPGRKTILSERENFPTDLYIAEGLMKQLGQGHRLKLVAPDEIAGAVDDDTAVVMLTHVNYRTGRMFDLNRVTGAAQAKGALMLWDLAHSAGAVPIDLTQANADFAIGCGYKFLNGGPGAPAFLTVAKRHIPHIQPALSGWFGHAAPFAFEQSYRPADGIVKMAVGTPPVLSFAALDAAVDLILEASIDAVRAKSLKQADIFAALMAQELKGHGFSLASPADPAQRGSQLCFDHEHGWPIMRALIARGVIGDYRAPNILRFGFTPLYLGFTELYDAIVILRDIMESCAWDKPEHHARARVT